MMMSRASESDNRSLPALLIGASAAAQGRAGESAIRAGHTIAVRTRISYHLVSPNQSLKPVLGPGIPSFAEIANRPNTTIESLAAAMKVARWRDPSMARTLLPMNHISDRGRPQGAAYIMSLRANP